MQLTLAGGQNALTMLAVAAAAVLLAGAFYYRAFGALGFRQWRTLLVLRVVAILLVVMLLFRPVLSYQYVSVGKPALIFLLDTSASMGIADDSSGQTRFDQARGKLVKWCESPEGRLPPAADRLCRAGRAAGESGPVAARSSRPARRPRFPRALAAAEKQFSPAEVAAVILLSDGIHNSAGNPAEVARQAGYDRRLRRRRRQPAQQPVLPRHHGDRHRLPAADAAGQPGPRHRLDRRHRAGRPRGSGVPGRGRPADRPGRIDPGRRGGLAASHLRVPARHARAATPTRSASRPCPKRRSSRTTSGRPWPRSSRRASTCCTSRGRCGPSTARWPTAFWPRTPTWSSAPWCRPGPTCSSSGRT